MQTQFAGRRSTLHGQFGFTQVASAPGPARCDATWPPPQHASPKLPPHPCPAVLKALRCLPPPRFPTTITCCELSAHGRTTHPSRGQAASSLSPPVMAGLRPPPRAACLTHPPSPAWGAFNNFLPKRMGAATHLML